MMIELVGLIAGAVACPAVTFAPNATPALSPPQRVHWTASERHRDFIVAVREAVPNGPRLLSAQRAVIEPHLQIVPSTQAPLTTFQLTVTAQCEGGGASAPVPLTLINDLRWRCASPQRVMQELSADGTRVRWATVAGTTSYQLALLDLADANPVWSGDTIRAEAVLPKLSRTALLQVRAVCGALVSVPAHLVVDVAD